jgi:hypothetical protein
MEVGKLAVPIFHAYAHNQRCQLNYNTRYKDGFGLENGECCERFWAYLNRFVSMTRKTTPFIRELILFEATLKWNEDKKMKMGKPNTIKPLKISF